jgi:hypothetical protein
MEWGLRAPSERARSMQRVVTTIQQMDDSPRNRADKRVPFPGFSARHAAPPAGMFALMKSARDCSGVVGLQHDDVGGDAEQNRDADRNGNQGQLSQILSLCSLLDRADRRGTDPNSRAIGGSLFPAGQERRARWLCLGSTEP